VEADCRRLDQKDTDIENRLKKSQTRMQTQFTTKIEEFDAKYTNNIEPLKADIEELKQNRSLDKAIEDLKSVLDSFVSQHDIKFTNIDSSISNLKTEI
jgi:predicted RNase H-like nuclease (RuvC/YqgF family)